MQQDDQFASIPQSPIVSEESIRVLIDTFYAAVRRDNVLGPLFEKEIQEKWPTHMSRMYDFWSTILLGTRKFQGNVYEKHMKLDGITPEHFVRWLTLFKTTAIQVLGEKNARIILEHADRIAGSLQLGFFRERLVRI